MKNYRKLSILLATTALVSLPSVVFAQNASREAELAARLAQLEAAVASLRAELASAKTAPTPAPAPAAAPVAAEGFKVGNTSVKIGGYIKTVATISEFNRGEVAANALGRDFYLPGQIPTGPSTNRSYQVDDFSSKQTRLWTNLTSDVAGHTLKGYLEGDFQTTAGAGSERTTNGYNFAMRRAYFQFDNWTIGQEWTTFQYLGALPESTDFVGVTEGTVFARQPQIRYSHKLSPKATWHFAIENSETASASSTGPALTENDDDKMPDLTTRFQYNGSAGELSIAGLVRQLNVNNGIVSDSANAWGVSVGGKVPFGEGKRSNLAFMATYGSGIGRYVGLNMVPDAIFSGGVLRAVDNFAATGSVKFSLSPKVRANIMASYQDAEYPSGFAAGTFNSYTKSSQSIAANIFITPVRGLDLGVEYRNGKRELVGGLDGTLNRLEFAAKYSF